MYHWLIFTLLPLVQTSLLAIQTRWTSWSNTVPSLTTSEQTTIKWILRLDRLYMSLRNTTQVCPSGNTNSVHLYVCLFYLLTVLPSLLQDGG